MSEFRYIIDDQNGNRWYLSEEGPQKLSNALAGDGFHQTDEHRIGSCVLHVFQREQSATDIVHEYHEVP